MGKIVLPWIIAEGSIAPTHHKLPSGSQADVRRGTKYATKAFMQRTEGGPLRNVMTLFLASFDLEEKITPEIDLDGDLFPLSPKIYLIRSGLSQSKVYHHIKWQLPPDTPLIVATLAEPPKFKRMAPGSLKWLRSGAAIDPPWHNA